MKTWVWQGGVNEWCPMKNCSWNRWKSSLERERYLDTNEKLENSKEKSLNTFFHLYIQKSFSIWRIYKSKQSYSCWWGDFTNGKKFTIRTLSFVILCEKVLSNDHSLGKFVVINQWTFIEWFEKICYIQLYIWFIGITLFIWRFCWR